MELLPGLGMVINKDTIFLDRFTPCDLTTLMEIKDTFELHIVQWDGYDTLGNEVYGTYYKKIIPFDNLYFEFTGLKEKQSCIKSNLC